MTCQPLKPMAIHGSAARGVFFDLASFYANRRRKSSSHFESFGSLALPEKGPLLSLRLCRRSPRPGVFDGPFLGLDLHHTRPIFQLEDLIAE